jgi:gamma-glutamylcyclotransferase (GGCT)/AIG2-like uncharacterized protein YtfP
MLHFAYGSNMSRMLMHRRCPTAAPIGSARLDGWRFIITRDGYASVVPGPGETVQGILWRLKPRDLAAVNAYESLDSGLYRRRMLPVTWGGQRVAALVYVARERRVGRPRPGYQELVVQAAREWEMPDDYVRALQRWQPARIAGIRRVETGEVA